MSIKINYKNKGPKNPAANLVLFVEEKFNINSLKKFISNTEYNYIFELLKTNDLKQNILVFEINSKKSIFLVSVKKDITASDIENLGAKFHKHINYEKCCCNWSRNNRNYFS